MKIYDEDFPIVLGICGQAASGKTSVASNLVPDYQMKQTAFAVFDHKFLAMPLYDMVAIRRKIKGESQLDRQLYMIHEALTDLFGRSPLYGAPPYDVLVDLAYEIAHLQIEMDEDKKPRDFLQQVGTMCRAVDEDCFVKWMHRAIMRDFSEHKKTDTNKAYVCIVSDVRMPNEAKFIAEHPNGVLVKFTVSPSIAIERQMKRDGFVMSQQQASHVSERIDDIPFEYIAKKIDSDSLSIEEQAQLTLDALHENLITDLTKEGING